MVGIDLWVLKEIDATLLKVGMKENDDLKLENLELRILNVGFQNFGCGIENSGCGISEFWMWNFWLLDFLREFMLD